MGKHDDEQLSRRTLLRLGAGAAAAAGFLATPWGRVFADGPDESPLVLPHGGQAKQVVLLFMSGGASHFETFDPKPGTSTGGPTRAIPTAVPGIHIAASLPQLAARMGDLALLRGMTSKEGNHDRARYLMHTGYAPTPTVVHPGLGSLLSHERGRPEADLPEAIVVNGPGTRPGYLGVNHAPFAIQVAPAGALRGGGPGGRNRTPGNRPVVQNLGAPAGMDGERRDARLGFLEQLNGRFVKDREADVAEAQRAMFERARRLMDSPRNTAFDLGAEKPGTLARYGPTAFGMGCLMARRLLEQGVTCVEVMMSGWDTHDDNFERVKALNGELDAGAAALLADLEAGGRLDSTLVVWVGDFGRTPRITATNGRGHYPQAWSAWLAGGGVQGGRLIGATDAQGERVVERPVTPPDLFASIAHATGMDPQKVFHSNGRPVQLVFKDGQPVKELFAS